MTVEVDNVSMGEQEIRGRGRTVLEGVSGLDLLLDELVLLGELLRVGDHLRRDASVQHE
jgi:hypothetical protein